jgi:hypothetical protein
MPHFGFGAGSLFGIDNNASPPTPVKFGALQEVDVEFAFTTKELYSQYQFPLAVGRGKSKITGKAKTGQIRADVYGQLFFGLTPATGQIKTAVDEAGSIPVTPGPYTVTVANSATWATDLGVFFGATGIPLTRVTSGPTTGQYSVSAGVYTFAAADQGLAVTISYTYTAAATGKTITLTNQLLGASPTFKVVLNNLYGAKDLTLTLNRCMSSKLSLPTKLEDFIISEFDFEAMADNSNTIGTLSTAE